MAAANMVVVRLEVPMLQLPNILTLSRIVAIPVMVGLFFVGTATGNWLNLIVFALACVTDFFDGYLARAWGQQSNLGRFLDPVADKLLIGALLVMVVATGRLADIHVLPAVVIMCRELLVSGLREFLADLRVSVPVTQLAKWKTSIQMLALGFLIVGPSGPNFGPLTTNEIGVFGLWVAAVLTLITGYDYLRAGLHHIKMRDGNSAGMQS
ncbi:MAG: CDP-diacylglycerol--glycerol-3-phosphate 3-phosphatidyltransferase [Magnetospiraceae bacterium]